MSESTVAVPFKVTEYVPLTGMHTSSDDVGPRAGDHFDASVHKPDTPDAQSIEQVTCGCTCADAGKANSTPPALNISRIAAVNPADAFPKRRTSAPLPRSRACAHSGPRGGSKMSAGWLP